MKLWPGIQETPREEDRIIVAANVKLSGYKVSDIDVVVGAFFGRKRYFVPTKVLRDADGKSVTGAKIRVSNLPVAIEVKGQDANGVSISGDELNVRYNGKWKSATKQNVEQVHALKDYFSDQHVDAWVYQCLVMVGLARLPLHEGVPRPTSGVVPLGFGGADLLTAIAGVYSLRKWGNEFVLSSSRQDQMSKVLSASIFRTIVPSRLDRTKMDRISSRPSEARKIADLLGSQRVHIRGHGGTGKTVLMLQAAHEACQRHGKRCLVLTYNRALAADIQRLLALLGVPARPEGGGVEVRTAMSFIFSWLNQLGISTVVDGAGFEAYSKFCSEALASFKAGALTKDDVAKIMSSDEEAFGFDALIVDEAQDWPQPEAELLSVLYGGEKIAVADGLDQLVRGSSTNWKRTLPAGASSEERSLVKCLRMKRNLGVFANAVSARAGLNWGIEPNDQAAGGNVILLLGDYREEKALQSRLVDEAMRAGNDKVDFLHCVPSSDVETIEGGRHSRLGQSLLQSGHEVWDGVDAAVRLDFPRSAGTFRVVQYESCRGLEGWTTVLERFDEFWTSKYDQALMEARLHGAVLARPPEDIAWACAWRWAMIPITRPIDTIVVGLRDRDGKVAKLLIDVAADHPDFISVRG
ncbi:AAA family ATPase [Bradyrhizobium japonicum]|uniref:AAA family ATPase n=1 Tax=Bradyrhizobium japonicum TaxID=375 RepID=UPI001BA4EB45|nr:AAA family ATPase [Bradyrhizobium japonicum]MBR0804336.1 AAA family ATPase [Bradyrhizobium japonicum]